MLRLGYGVLPDLRLVQSEVQRLQLHESYLHLRQQQSTPPLVASSWRWDHLQPPLLHSSLWLMSMLIWFSCLCMSCSCVPCASVLVSSVKGFDGTNMYQAGRVRGQYA